MSQWKMEINQLKMGNKIIDLYKNELIFQSAKYRRIIWDIKKNLQ